MTHRLLQSDLLGWLFWGWLFWGCGAPASPPDHPDTTSVATHPPSSIALPATPSYVRAVASGDGALLYAEVEGPDGLAALVVELDADGTIVGPPQVLVDHVDLPLGEPAVTQDQLAVAVLRGNAGGDGESRLELWRWSPGAVIDRLLSCSAMDVVDGQVFLDSGEILMLLSTRSGGLRGFRTQLDHPACPEETAWVELTAGPLPTGYGIHWLDGQVAVSGLVGGSYEVRLYTRELESGRYLRLAAGQASEPGDLTLIDLESRGPVALYSARVDGAPDLYLAPLNQLRAGPLNGDRIVASAESERTPVLFERRGRLVVSWAVFDRSDGEHLVLAGVLAGNGSALPGGEVVWRLPRGPETLTTSVWTDAGLLRIWSEGNRLQVALYEPTFWHRD